MQESMAVGDSASPSKYASIDREQFKTECCAIADWWLRYATDRENGGFYGAVNYRNEPDRDAKKCVIMNVRALWFFSAAARFTGRRDYYDAAIASFDYVAKHFVDREHGGVLWMLDAKGAMVDGRKHTYAQAFAIYAFSEFYDLTKSVEALRLSLDCFELIETHAKDSTDNGYLEGFTQSWGALDDVRLSAKEDNSPKTMNTNLHVLEAYTALHNAVRPVHPSAKRVAAALANELQVFCDHIVDLDGGHVRMFMNEQWVDHSTEYSFGHDIESSWLIQKAMHSLVDTEDDVARFQGCVDRLAEVGLARGLRPNGCMLDECNIASGQTGPTAWWVQAEAMVGFACMWSRGHGEQYLHAVMDIWAHVQEHYIDAEHGEWHWFAKYDLAPEESEYKVGPWKGPYHSGRAMMQVYALLSRAY